MTDIDRDPLVGRAVDALRELPPADAAMVKRIVEAAAVARVSAADEPRPRVRPRWPLLIGVAAAAAIVGFIGRGLIPSSRSSIVSPPETAPAPMRNAAVTSSDASVILQQFVIDRASAKRVAVVGDFNNWNPSSAPMTRSPDGTLWSVIVPVVPGRHVYGFMIDDSVFMLDPRAPKVRDPDLGTDASVLMTGRP